jgi:hypothetical protein
VIFRYKRKSVRLPFLLLTLSIDNMLRRSQASVNARPRLDYG